jgi:hypothetical protein
LEITSAALGQAARRSQASARARFRVSAAPRSASPKIGPPAYTWIPEPRQLSGLLSSQELVIVVTVDLETTGLNSPSASR